MVHFWIFTVIDQRIGQEEKKGIEIYKKRMSDAFWGLSERTPNHKWLKEDDYVIFYLGRSEGKKFLGTSVLSSGYYELDEKEKKKLHHGPFFQSNHGVKLKNIEVWDEPINIHSVAKRLKFIRNKQIWWTYLQGGIREISEDDYNVIVSEHELKEIIKLSDEKKPSLTETPSIVQVNVKARDAAFRKKIREIYDYSCAVCGRRRFAKDGLPEVEASHIYPKGKNGKDDLKNGITLCRLHHWAFDGGLFSIKDDYSIVVDKAIKDDKNYEEIYCFENETIRLPKEEKYKPHAVFLAGHRRIHNFK